MQIDSIQAEASREGATLPSGGELNSAIANAVVRMIRDYVGRGPTKAQAFFHNNVVVVILHDTQTRAERSLVAAGQPDAVLGMRRRMHTTMRAELTALVEELTRCGVLACMGAADVEPDIASIVFVLDGPVPGSRAR
jgi:uncharacterized protein YbcI